MRPVLANLIDKFSVKKVVIPCFVLEIISFILLFIAKNELCLVLSAVFRGIGVAGTQTALVGMAIKSVPSEKRGLASNTSYIGLDLGGFIGSNLAGMIVAMFGYRNLYAVMILFLVLAILILVRYFKKTTDFVTRVD
jgi:MFS family permease